MGIEFNLRVVYHRIVDKISLNDKHKKNKIIVTMRLVLINSKCLQMNRLKGKKILIFIRIIQYCVYDAFKR